MLWRFYLSIYIHLFIFVDVYKIHIYIFVIQIIIIYADFIYCIYHHKKIKLYSALLILIYSIFNGI